MGYLYLSIAILTEVFGSTSLKLSQGFTKLAPSLMVVLGMSSAFYFLSLSLRTLPLSICYAIWSGVGTVLTAIVGVLLFKEVVNIHKVIGIAIILLGVVYLNLKGGTH